MMLTDANETMRLEAALRRAMTVLAAALAVAAFACVGFAGAQVAYAEGDDLAAAAFAASVEAADTAEAPDALADADAAAAALAESSDPDASLAATAEWRRLSGDDRYATAKAISKATVRSGSGGTVVVASGENYPDALAASAYAGLFEAPVLLTAANVLTDAARTEIERIGASRVVVMGGTSAVSSAVEDALRAIGGVQEVVRISGADRVATAEEIARAGAQLVAETAETADSADSAETQGWGDIAFVASGANYPDALSASSYAYAKAAPVFLTQDDGTLAVSTVALIRELGFSQIVILGGEKAVNGVVSGQLGEGIPCSRLGGANRYETSLLIANWAVDNGLSADGLAVATGENYPDALSSSALAGSRNAVVLLVNDGTTGGACISGFVAAHASDLSQAYILGGRNAVSYDLARTLLQTTGSTIDIEGVYVEAAEAAYTGSAVQPATVQIRGINSSRLVAGNELALGRDFTVASGSDTVHVGTRTITIQGTGIYTGAGAGPLSVYLPDGVYTFGSTAGSDIALGVADGSYYAGAGLQFAAAGDGAEQMFQTHYLGGGAYALENYRSKKYVDVDGSVYAEGAGAVQQAESGGTGQRWVLSQDEAGALQISAAGSGLAIGAAGGAGAVVAGASAVLCAVDEDGRGDSSAQFTFAAVPAWKTEVTGYKLEVNRTQNVLNVYGYIGTGDTIAVKAMLCSAGEDGATPVGTFAIYEKRRWSDMAGGTAAQFCSPFYGPYYIHSVPYWTYGDNSSLEVDEYDLLGENRSMGCIRLCCGDAMWVYDNCDIGTEVTTYDSDDPGPFGKPDPIPRTADTPEGWDPTDPLLG